MGAERDAKNGDDVDDAKCQTVDAPRGGDFLGVLGKFLLVDIM